MLAGAGAEDARSWMRPGVGSGVHIWMPQARLGGAQGAALEGAAPDVALCGGWPCGSGVGAAPAAARRVAGGLCLALSWGLLPATPGPVARAVALEHGTSGRLGSTELSPRRAGLGRAGQVCSQLLQPLLLHGGELGMGGRVARAGPGGRGLLGSGASDLGCLPLGDMRRGKAQPGAPGSHLFSFKVPLGPLLPQQELP